MPLLRRTDADLWRAAAAAAAAPTYVVRQFMKMNSLPSRSAGSVLPGNAVHGERQRGPNEDSSLARISANPAIGLMGRQKSAVSHTRKTRRTRNKRRHEPAEPCQHAPHSPAHDNNPHSRPTLAVQSNTFLAYRRRLSQPP